MKHPHEKLFFLIGVDGSGKTTITHEIIRICRLNNIPCQNLWSRFNNYFSLPVIGITKLSGHCYYKKIMGKHMGFHDYENLIVLKELFFLLQIIDVNIATFFHITRKLNRKKLTICERGPYDTFVDVLADTKLDSKLFYKFGKMFSMQIDRKKPIVIYIKRNFDNIVLTRPELIYDKKLPSRIKTYEHLARKHKWFVVDNNGSLSETKKEIQKIIFSY
jgi:thymidylate kinase